MQSALLNDNWHVWTHTQAVPFSRWLTTTTNPEALVVISTTSTWSRELWMPATNHVSSTVLWTEKSSVPSPSWNASTSQLLILSRKGRTLQATVLNPLTNESQVLLLPQKWTGSSIILQWWQAQSAWIVWSSTGEGMLLNEQGKIIARVERQTKGKTTTKMQVRFEAAGPGASLMNGEKRVSVLRIRPTVSS